LFCFGS
jgi:hypothetical protein